MIEVYELGYVVSVKEGKLVIRGELGRREVELGADLVLAGRGKLSFEALACCAARRGRLSLRQGFTVARLVSPRTAQSSLVRAQLEALDDSLFSLEIARRIVRASSQNKLWIMRTLESLGYDVSEEIEDVAKLVEVRVSSRAELRALEARITRSYHEALRVALDPEYGFEARTRRPPRDCFSAAISYGYTKLYRYVEAALLAAGLDPRLGFLHEPFRKRPSLALDLAEVFRQPVVDAALLTLFLTKTLKPHWHFRREGDAVYLGNRGRSLVDRALRRRLDMKVRGRTLLEWITLQALALADAVARRGEYEPFHML